MSDIEIRGGKPLFGELSVQGSKNGVLPVMAAAILNRETVVLENVPGIQDVSCMMGILDSLGCRLGDAGSGRLTIDASGVSSHTIDRDAMSQMRSSIMLLGPLLGRVGQVEFSSPGGCSIGERPIDLHRQALEQMGVCFEERDGVVTAKVSRLKGAVIGLPFPSVGATENVVAAAVLAEGETVLEGAAREPEIGELCRFLNACGAKIEGAGTGTIRIRGVKRLHGCTWRVGGDRIVAGTYLIAAAACGGEISLRGADAGQLSSVCGILAKTGAKVESGADRISLKAEERPEAVRVATGPYPGFPTDLQSPLLALCCVARGESVIEETVFEGRFKTAGELARLGAAIGIDGRTARIEGRECLVGGHVRATDLRGGAALVIAGLLAQGTAYIGRREYIDRGYEDIVRDLRTLGARIKG